MTTKYKSSTTSVAVHLESESPIYGESTISVSLDDEAAGIFLELQDGEGVKIRVDYEQWIEINKAVEFMMKQKMEGV